MLRAPGPIRPTQSAFATSDNAQDKKYLLSGPIQAILPSNGRPLEECRMIRRRQFGANGLTAFQQLAQFAAYYGQRKHAFNLSGNLRQNRK